MDRRSALMQNAKIEELKRENTRLQALISEIRTASPSIARLADLAVWREREAFEEKTRRALVLLRKKDAKIRELEEAVTRRRTAGAVDGRSTTGGSRDHLNRSRIGGVSAVGGGRSGGNGAALASGGSNVVLGDVKSDMTTGLEGCVRGQAEQIEALVEEVARLRSARTPTAQRPDAHQVASSLTEARLAGGGREASQKGVMGYKNPDAAAVDATEKDLLRTQAAQLKAALAAQTAALTEKEAALRQASDARRREAEGARQREEVLSARIATLERIEEAARRTVLAREERLRQAEPTLGTLNKEADLRRTDDGGDAREEGVQALFSDVIVRPSGSRMPEGNNGEAAEPSHACSTAKDLQGFFGAQEWWLHLARATSDNMKDGVARPGTHDSMATGKENAGVDRNGTIERLRQLLHDQALEIVTLRQRALKAEMGLRVKAGEEEERAMDAGRRVASLEHALRTRERADSTLVAELEAQVTVLRVRGELHQALATAREEATAGKLAVIRAEGDANLHAQLLKDEKQRSAAALSRAEDLQNDLDKIAVAGTLRDVPGGVSPSALIDHFASTALRQSQRIEALEGEVRNMRNRCARLAHLARGDPTETLPAVSGGGNDDVAASVERRWQEEGHGDEWMEATVQEAAAAMKAGRRRALEQEIESLRQELLTETRRTKTLEREAADARRQQKSTGDSTNGNGRQEENTAVLRRELARSSSEIEALRVHAADLRSRLQSGNWSWHTFHVSRANAGHSDEDDALGIPQICSGVNVGVRATAALKEIGITANVNDADQAGSSSCEVSRLRSLLIEKNAQVSVLTATVEALRLPSTSMYSPPIKSGGIPGGSDGGERGRGRSASPCRRATCDNKHAPTGNCLKVTDDNAYDVDGGVSVLRHISAQGLVGHCVGLASRLISTMARAWASERRADRFSVELERKDRETRAAEAKLGVLAEQNRLLEIERSNMAAALKEVRTESSARLREAGEEASKMRCALRDAELGADDARQKRQSATDEGLALEAELRQARDRYRDEVNRLSEGHVTRLKEFADRLSSDGSILLPMEQKTFASEAGAKTEMAATMASPLMRAIAQLAEQWRAYVKEGGVDNTLRKRPSSSGKGDHRSQRTGTDEGGAAVRINCERQRAAVAFLQEMASRLDEECARAVRRARALEWELRGARQEALDSVVALEASRVERARLSARATLAEAAVAAASSNSLSLSFTNSMAGPDNSLSFRTGSSGGGVFGLGAPTRGDSGGFGCRQGSYTAAAVFLLEKRLDAAMEDLVAARAARGAAEAGQAAAMARAEAAEAHAAGTLASADVLEAELERHKASVSHSLQSEALEWRREIRAELERWWQEDLLQLHEGIALDWGSAGAADGTAAACATSPRPRATTVLPNHRGDSRFSRRDSIYVGVSGEEAMAQALIAGRVEQAILEERLLAREQCLSRVRGEALRLRSILERWHSEFVMPAVETSRLRRSSATVLTKAPAVNTGTPVNECLERKVLAVTADLLGARNEAAGLRAEITALRALVARVRQDEREARDHADRRVESARETVQRRADGDLRDAAERLAEERERFKLQLGVIHADILRLRAEAAELERRNQELELARSGGNTLTWSSGSKWRSGGSKPKYFQPGDDLTVHKDASETGDGVEREGEEKGEKAPVEEGRNGDVESERTLREALEEEREALRRMCNGLAVDLQTAVEAEAKAKEERQALVQEAAKAKAEAQTAVLARESQEAALRELGRLLEHARERATPSKTVNERSGSLKAEELTLVWDRSKEEAGHFARVMVAAKVAEADLLRRLQDAAAGEAELRHMLRRGDLRIEELKREQAKADHLSRRGREGSTTPWSILAGRPCTGARDSRIASDATFALSRSKESGGGQTVLLATRTERAEKEVSQAALVLRLQLELAEAAARGDVGDASTRAASRLAVRLVPSGGAGECELCGRSREWGASIRSTALPSESQQERRESFLMPSAEFECKAAAGMADAEKVPSATAALSPGRQDDVCRPSDADTVGDRGHRPLAEGERLSAGNDGLMPGEIRRLFMRSHSHVGTETSRRPLPRHPHELSNGVRSLEAQLSQFEHEVGSNDGFVAGADSMAEGGGSDGGLLRSLSPAARTPGLVKIPLAEAVRELKAQVAELRNCAECTEQLLNENWVEKQELEAEVLRLRAELLRQQRGYSRATATLKDRYERALAGEYTRGVAIRSVFVGRRRGAGGAMSPRAGGDEDFAENRGIDGKHVVNAGYSRSNVPDSNAYEIERRTIQGQRSAGTGEMSSKESGCTGAEPKLRLKVEIRSLRKSLHETKDGLAEKELQLQKVRELHLKESAQVREELVRVVEAHRVRVAMLEETVQQVRKRLRSLARSQLTRERKKSRSASVSGGRDGDAAKLSGSAIALSTDELLNMLAAADEQTFEAKGRAQHAEYNLRARSAEADALRRTIVALSCNSGGGDAAGSHHENAAPAGGRPADGVGDHLIPHDPAARVAVGASELTAVACAARLAAAEAEVERLRDEGLAASQAALEAQREASALRIASRASMVRAGDGRVREKELGGVRSDHIGATAEAEAAAAVELPKARAQLSAAREHLERRGRAIAALRAVKGSLEKQLEGRQKKTAEVEAKLERALKDAGVKGNAVQVLRGKVSALEADIQTLQAARPCSTAAAVAIVAPVAECIHPNAGSDAATDNSTTPAGTVAQPHVDSFERSRRNDGEVGDSHKRVMRQLRAERDRLRANMRAWQGLLSKKATELDARMVELERIEEQARVLRAAVARKDDAYRTVKKQLVSVRHEYELFKISSHRWQVDAQMKWRDLKEASESATREARTCRRSGDAAERELVALKSAFRSFLKTLWVDLRSRPTGLLAEVATGNENGLRHKDSDSLAGNDRAAAAAAISPTFKEVVDESGADDSAAHRSASVANPDEVEWECRWPGPFAGSFPELTEAEVSDIMRSLSPDYSLASSSSPTANAALNLLPRAADHVPPLLGDSTNNVSEEDTSPAQPPGDRVPEIHSQSRSCEVEEEEAISAKLESALSDRDTSAALAGMLRSMRSSQVRPRRSMNGTSHAEHEPATLPPPPPLMGLAVYPDVAADEPWARKAEGNDEDVRSSWPGFSLTGGVRGQESDQTERVRLSGGNGGRYGFCGEGERAFGLAEELPLRSPADGVTPRSAGGVDADKADVL